MRGQGKVYQKKIVVRRRKKAFLILLYTTILVVVLGAGLSFISQLDALRIQKIVVSGTQRASVADIERSVMDRISGNYFNFFAKANTFIYPKDEVRESLLILPAVSEVKIRREGFQGLSVEIKERDEVALWCMYENPNQCFKVDGTGLVYAPQTYECENNVCERGVEQSFVYQSNIIGEPIGSYVMKTDEFEKIHFFVNEITKLDLSPIRAMIDSDGYITLGLKDGGEILIYSKDDLTKILDNLITFMSDKTVVLNQSQFLKNLDYIKIDSGNKIVYKLKNSTNTVE